MNNDFCHRCGVAYWRLCGCVMRCAALGLALLLAGCSSTNVTEYLKALSGDQATVCVSVVYAGASAKVSRTNIINGDVLCNDNGMTIKSLPAPINVLNPMQLPAQITIQQPVTVAPTR